MSLWRSAEGRVYAELTSADLHGTLRLLNDNGIRLESVHQEDELTACFCCSRRDRKAISRICSRKGDRISFRAAKDLFWLGTVLLKRPVLTFCLLLLYALTLFLPTRVLFLQVEGNERIPSKQIVEAAEACGIRFGASRRQVRSEKMKNALLAAMPELQWAGINTSGCTAVIRIKERNPEEEQPVSSGVGNIVAARDGYITSCTVTKGSAACQPGQIVKEGQLLISGYTDCGICMQVTEAKGEVFALTNHVFRGYMPINCMAREEERTVTRRYSLIIGKNRINLWKGSGISPVTCGRMYEEYYITLPGDFVMPVCLAVETLTNWELVQWQTDRASMEAQLKSFARQSVLEKTVAGTILQENHVLLPGSEQIALEGRYVCSEMIGRVITEEIGETNGKND